MDELLMLPGPTAVPPEVLAVQSRQMIGHREEAFSQLLTVITSNLKKLWATEDDVLIFPSSGTGGLEIAVVNSFSPGDRVLSVVNGVFGQRFREIARAYGLEILELNYPWGQACDYEQVAEALRNNPDLKGVLFTHNETSTGVLNDLQKMGQITRSHQALLLVDAVSSFAGAPLDFADWGIDLAVTSSQKALMTPPGLAVAAVSKQAWSQIEQATLPRFYWDLIKAKKYYDQRHQTPYTPAVSLLYALDKALKLILKEGREQVFQRHRLMARALREGFIQLNIKPFVPSSIASSTVSSFLQPDNVSFPALKQQLLNRYNLHITGGQAGLKDRIFRVGHMGYVDGQKILDTIQFFAKGLKDFGVDVETDRAVARAESVLREELSSDD